MASGNITIRAVQALAPGEAIWDAGHKEAVRGFGVRRQRNQATYVVKYRMDGRQRFYTIGPHGSPWTPDTARRKAKQLLGLVADRKDPAEAKAQARLEAADTLRKIIDVYLKAVEPKQRPKTHSEIKRYLNEAWKPLHSISVFKITRRQVTAQVARIAETHGAVTATRARAALCTLFNWTISEGLDLPANPVLGSNRPAQPKSRDRVLADTELRAIWRACANDDYGRIVRLLMLTAQRRDEVGGMQWDEIAGNLWTIPGVRTKNHREHVLPLTASMLELIQAQPHRNDRDFIFGNGPRRKDNEPRGFGGWSKSKAALDARIFEASKKAAKDAGEDAGEVKPLPHWTLHDLRRTAATVMTDRLGVLPHIVEAILNHVSGHRAGVAGIYNRARYEGEMREALKRWSKDVAALVA